jgi:hypothetical protein
MAPEVVVANSTPTPSPATVAMKRPPPPELDTILRMLPARWTLSSLEWWAMGWVAEIDSRRKKFQLVSDRGYLDVYELVEGQQRHISPPEERRTSLTPKQVCALLTNTELAPGSQRHMSSDQLITEGQDLAAALEAAACRYHVKDDRRDVLGYEAGTVDAYVLLLRDGTPVPDHLKESTLLGPWGRRLHWQKPELSRRTAAFHEALRRFLGLRAWEL